MLENNFEFQFLFQEMELKHDCTYEYPPIGASFSFQYCEKFASFCQVSLPPLSGVVVRVWWRKREAAENKVGSFVWKKNGHREQRIDGKYSKWRRADN